MVCRKCRFAFEPLRRLILFLIASQPSVTTRSRLHSALRYLSPAQFEDHHAQQTVKTAA